MTDVRSVTTTPDDQVFRSKGGTPIVVDRTAKKAYALGSDGTVFNIADTSITATIDDTPVNGETTHSISSNWAFDHVAASDPHTGYRLESENHTHQSSGLQGGQLDHGLALAGLTDDDHTQYLLASQATDRATFTANWTDLTDGGDTTLHTHSFSGVTGFDEAAQDAVGGILTDTATIDLTYNDAGGRITADVKQAGLDHGSIGGLADDDHTQYLLANGTRALSADWDAGSFEIRAQTFESDVATGTAPLTIASTTVVTNLNADLLDGNEATAFAVAAKGVTNGDSQDHFGGDGPQINHTTLSNIGTNTHAQIDTHIAGTGTAVHGLGTISTQNANNVSITGGAISGITDLAVADGGTGASTAQSACANLKAPYVLAHGAAGYSHTGDLNETALATITVPANAMGANGMVRITTTWTFTSSANNKTSRVRFNGISGTVYLARTVTTTTSQQHMVMVSNRNATNSQVGFQSGSAAFEVSANACVTSAIDTTAAVDISITGQLANSGETITLERYLVELIVP